MVKGYLNLYQILVQNGLLNITYNMLTFDIQGGLASNTSRLRKGMYILF